MLLTAWAMPADLSAPLPAPFHVLECFSVQMSPAALLRNLVKLSVVPDSVSYTHLRAHET